MDVLQELDGQQQLGERVAQRRHDADVRRLELARDARERHGLRRDVDAPGRQRLAEGAQPRLLDAGAADPQADPRRVVLEPSDGLDQQLDAEARREPAVVDRAQRAVRGPSDRGPLGPEHALIGRVHDDRRAPAADAAVVEPVAGLGGDADDGVGERGRDALLDRDQAHGRMRARALEARCEQLRERVVDVEDHLCAPQLGHQPAEGEHVGHVVRLDDVEAARALERGHLAQRAEEEAPVSAQVAARAAGGLGERDAVHADDPRADPQLAGGREADQVHLVAPLGQRARLALDPRVDVEVRVVDHADPQRAAGRGHAAALSCSALFSEIGWPLRRSDASAASIAIDDLEPQRGVGAGHAARPDGLREVLELQAQRLPRVDARDHDVAAAVGELVLAEVLGRDEVHAAVVDADGLVGLGVVVDDHPLAPDHDHLADLARREPGDLDVRVRPAREGQGQERGLGDAGLEDAAGRRGDLHDGLARASRAGSTGRAARGRRSRRRAGTCRGSSARR